MKVKYHLTVDGGAPCECWLHRGTFVLSDTTSEKKVIKSVRQALNMEKGCCSWTRTESGWNVSARKKAVSGSVTLVV